MGCGCKTIFYHCCIYSCLEHKHTQNNTVHFVITISFCVLLTASQDVVVTPASPRSPQEAKCFLCEEPCPQKVSKDDWEFFHGDPIFCGWCADNCPGLDNDVWGILRTCQDARAVRRELSMISPKFEIKRKLQYMSQNASKEWEPHNNPDPTVAMQLNAPTLGWNLTDASSLVEKVVISIEGKQIEEYNNDTYQAVRVRNIPDDALITVYWVDIDED